MDLYYNALLWTHFLGLAFGGAATFGHPVLGAIAAKTPEARPHMARAGRSLSMFGRAGIVLLVVSGVLLMLQRFDFGAMPTSFWIKMALVVVLVINVVMAGFAAKAAVGGDKAMAARLPIHGMIGLVVLPLLIVFAVLAFG